MARSGPTNPLMRASECVVLHFDLPSALWHCGCYIWMSSVAGTPIPFKWHYYWLELSKKFDERERGGQREKESLDTGPFLLFSHCASPRRRLATKGQISRNDVSFYGPLHPSILPAPLLYVSSSYPSAHVAREIRPSLPLTD